MERRIWGLGLAFVFGFLFASQQVCGEVMSSFKHGAGVKSQTFLSPRVILGPGEVSNKNYKLEFPTGHIALKGFDAELVDEEGNAVPLHEVYLHHWVVERNYVEETINPDNHFSRVFNSTVSRARNDGVCQNYALDQVFGLGSETRHTNYAIPDPYGIVVGDPNVVPEGSSEGWLLNLHAIDTRQAMDVMGCIECRCDLYNVDVSKSHLPSKYIGGIDCCLDGMQCALAGEAEKKSYYLKYTVHWVDWDPTVVPVKVYIFDVTDDGERAENDYTVGCKIEYDIAVCNKSLPSATCVDTRIASMPPLPKGGTVVYGVAHQHAGGIGCSMFGEDGRELCVSEPLYGTGTAAGDEAGYIVGMSSCFPINGDVTVHQGERLRLHSRYSSIHGHTGVMGLFYLMVDDSDTKADSLQLATSKNDQGFVVWHMVYAAALVISVVGLVAAIRLLNKEKMGFLSRGYELLG